MAEAESTIYTSRSVVLKAAIKEGLPGPEHFDIQDSEVSDNLEEGQCIVQIMYMAVDPYLRSGPLRSDASAGKAVKGFVSGKVVKSNSQKWKEGAKFGGNLPFSTYQIIDDKAGIWPLGDTPDEQMSLAIGALGMPGSTAYGGITDILNVKEGDVVWISAAAGAVGSIAGQIAKVRGAIVIGTAGSQEKLDWLKSIGFDHALNYKGANTGEELAAMIKEVAPDGIDCYFENVGGIHFEAAMSLLKTRGRVAVCGVISKYNENLESGNGLVDKINVGKMIYKQQKIEGFLAGRYLRREVGDFVKDISGWIAEGKISVKETPFEGIENWPLALQSIFTGKSMGKITVKTY